MTVFKMRSYKKTPEHSTPLTAKADKSYHPPPSGSSGGEGEGVFARKQSGEAAHLPPSLDIQAAEVVTRLDNLSRPAWQVLAQQPGHCGSCARWKAHPAPSEHIGMCSAGRRACGDMVGAPLAPIEIQAGHACLVYGNQGYRKRSGAAVKP